jgi:hypothetical protein
MTPAPGSVPGCRHFAIGCRRTRAREQARSSPPFPTSLYLTEDEFAAEVVNQTMHGVMHPGAVPDGTGGYRAQVTVLVKPNGLFGNAYMAAIRPFRHLIVYPALMREAPELWERSRPTPARAQ